MNKIFTKTDYQCNVIAYIAMYIRDVIADENSDNDDLLCYDIVFEISEGLANDFIGGDYDSSLQPLYTCIEEFMHSNHVQDILKDFK